VTALPLRWRGDDPRRLPVEVRLMVRLYRHGATLQQIASLLGCGTTTVWRRLREAGESRRLPNSTRLS